MSKEPVKVFCRLRPMIHPNDISCMKITSNTSLVITSPDSVTNIRIANKAIQTSFNHVFGENASQKEVFDLVALPLVENLISGKNSLLFTYGVTGSGKTYTMSGNPHDAGIMPRSLDIIFNSIVNCQAKKFTFKPDKLNGFDVQSEADALLDRQNELQKFIISQNGRTPKMYVPLLLETIILSEKLISFMLFKGKNQTMRITIMKIFRYNLLTHKFYLLMRIMYMLCL